MVVKTRKIIIDLYINCEKDFQKGLKIYEAIVKSKMLVTQQRRIEQFEKKADELQDAKKEEKDIPEKQPVEQPGEQPAVQPMKRPNVQPIMNPQQNIQLEVTEKKELS